MPAPGFNQDPSLGQGVEDLPVQEFVTHRAVEGLAVAILPWAAGCDVERVHTDLRQPLLHGIGDKFRAIVRPYVCRWPARAVLAAADVAKLAASKALTAKLDAIKRLISSPSSKTRGFASLTLHLGTRQ
jgi:hypothetical protein